MTAVDVLGRVDELTDGTGGSVDVGMGTAIGPYRRLRLRCASTDPLTTRVSALSPGDRTRRPAACRSCERAEVQPFVDLKPRGNGWSVRTRVVR